MNKKEAADFGQQIVKYITTFFKWFALSILIAAVCGGMGTLFHLLIEKATELRTEYDFIIYFLPLGGVLIVALYHWFKLEKIDGTNYVMNSIRSDGKVPATLAPGIVLGTVITHLTGGSAGREGAALQLGGSLGSVIGRIFRLDKDDMHVIVLCGMSSVFTALFGTPLTAVVFVLEVINVGNFYYGAIMPCIFSSILTYLLSLLLKVEHATYFMETVPNITAISLSRTAALGVVFALASIALCVSLKLGSKGFKKLIKNAYLRVIAGGAVIVLLTLLLGTDYNGAGMNIVERAVIDGYARPEAFILKLIFTVITLESGFKGGEIVPTLFIGSTLGCVVAPLIGMDASFGAALGLIGVFCGATNAPLASLFMSIEMFGAKGLPYFAVVCAVSFMLSGYFSLYKSQIIVYDKLKSKFVNRNTQ